MPTKSGHTAEPTDCMAFSKLNCGTDKNQQDCNECDSANN